MADKEASIYIVDVGSSLAKAHHGRSESDLDWSMRYVWDKITTTAQAKRKTLCIGVLGLRTNETNNALSKDEGYEHISVLKELGPVSLPDIQQLRSKIRPSQSINGDALSSVVVASEMIVAFTKRNKWDRRIYLITDGTGAIYDAGLADIAARLNDIGISLTIIGVDFDDPVYGFKEEDKDSFKASNEQVLKAFVARCDNGVFATMAEAIEGLAIPRAKVTKLVRSYDGQLTLGDLEISPHAINMAVERWPVTKKCSAESATTVVLKSETNATQTTMTMDHDLEGQEDESRFNEVRSHRIYKINDPEAPGGKRDVDPENLARGYTYGSSAIHIAESEWSITKLETIKSFSIIGFVASEKMEPFVAMAETSVTVAKQYDEKSQLALSSLVHALHELDHYAVARFVAKDSKDPVVLLLKPCIDVDMECLYDVPLPFAEDVRQYRFPPLDKVFTITGKTLTEHRFLPDDKLRKAMSNYVDAMDISDFGQDDEGNAAEYASFDELYSPIIHRVNQAIRARAVDNQGSIDEVPQVLVKYARPPEDLLKKAHKGIEALIKAADVKRTPEKSTGKRKGDSAADTRPISGFDAGASILAAREKKKLKVTKENAIPDFKQILRSLSTVKTDQGIETAMKGMADVVSSLIKESFGDQNYDQAIENVGVMREQMIGLEMPKLYNDFLRDLKTQLNSEAFGGDRRDMWYKIRWSGKLGLITTDESETSSVTKDDAQKFWRASS
ncbi:ATP-dependent DNA helicase II [Coniella lustricola]|uniref:ATP-dependent DNA helicase II subunit 2 n=1 Tax=Coniella lustricola TaxID=2025994 RepID=A0A2T3AN48_9PEZI|nr:ATP-dependent DNA helicase II [Coniella lustricola]